MATMSDSSVSLVFSGDDLDADAVSCALGVTASRSGNKGAVESGINTVNSRMLKTGFWRLQSEDSAVGDMDGQIASLFAQATDDLEVWRDLSRRYQAKIFFGWFLSSGNDVAELSAQTVQACAARGLAFCFDVYDFLEEAEPAPTD